MPRPSKPITAENFAQLHRQLARILADPQKVTQDINVAPGLAASPLRLWVILLTV